MSDPSYPRAGKRTSADSDEASRKKAKKEERDDDEPYNPYLAHIYEGNGRSNGFKTTKGPADSPLAGMTFRETTAEQALTAEDSKSNPFTGRPHSQKYFGILQTRRDLPVSKQRFVALIPHLWHHSTDQTLEQSFSRNTTQPRSSSSSVRPVPARRHRSRNTSSTMSFRRSPASLLPAHSLVVLLPCPSPSVLLMRWTSSWAKRWATVYVSRI